MRSNIACTSGSGSVPGVASDMSLTKAEPAGRLLEHSQERDQVLELLRLRLGQAGGRRARRGGVPERRGDRRRAQDRADVGEVGAGAVVAVGTDQVTGL